MGFDLSCAAHLGQRIFRDAHILGLKVHLFESVHYRKVLPISTNAVLGAKSVILYQCDSANAKIERVSVSL